MSVAQLKTDAYLLITIANHIGAGSVKVDYNSLVALLRISNSKAIQHLILPASFFNKYPLLEYKISNLIFG